MMQEKRKMNEIPKEQRPYERCEALGPSALSDAELLAVLLRSGTKEKSALRLAEEVLSLHQSENGLLNLMEYSPADFSSLKGIGRVRSLQLQCVGELSRRIWKQQAAKALDVRNPATVADYYKEDLRHLDYECAYLMLLDNRDQLRKSLCIARGTIQCASVSPREVFKAAIAHRASGVIFIHNHPSGNPAPSRDDCRLTGRLRRGGEALGIFLRDHVIIGDNCYYSFMENNILNEV